MVKLTTFFYISVTYFTHKIRRPGNTLTAFINERIKYRSCQMETELILKTKVKGSILFYFQIFHLKNITFTDISNNIFYNCKRCSFRL